MCRRHFERGAAPRWAFDAHGRPLGAIQISCATMHGNVAAASIEEAQRGLYVYVLHDAREE